MRRGVVASGVVALALLWPAPARASGHVAELGLEEGVVVALGVAALFLPNEAGVLVDRRAPYFAAGWSWQIPLTTSFRHRLIGSIDWVPKSDEHRLGGRLGYRFSTRYVFTGLGASSDPTGVTWSPEIGLKFLHASKPSDHSDLSLHVVVRGEIAPSLNEFRALTVLVGWNIF